MHKKIAFLITLFIYVILFSIFTHQAPIDDIRSLKKNENRVQVKLCVPKKEIQKSVKKKIKIKKEYKKIGTKPRVKKLKKNVLLKNVKYQTKTKELIVKKTKVKKPNTDEVKTIEKIIEKKESQIREKKELGASKKLISSIERALREHIYYPKAARRMQLEAKITLIFKILPNNELANIQISGDAPPILLRAAKKTLTRASTDFEKVKNAVTIEVPLQFTLEK